MIKARMEWTGKFLHYLARRFATDKLSNIAATLTLTSLLAVIPLLAVVFTILSALPFAQNLGLEIQAFIFSNFVPAVTDDLQLTVIGFVEKASNMKALGFTFLVITAIMLLRTIDAGFNQIWRTKQRRKALVAFIIYWSVLILGPLFLGISIALSSFFTSLLIVTDTGRQIGAQLTIILPWLLTTIGLAILYLVIPNSRVKISHAITGAMVAGILFELSKRLFTMYVTSFPMQEIIFGALSAVPLFMIWVYLSWLVILLGAEVCHGLENFTPERVGASDHDSYFMDSLRVLEVIQQDTNNLERNDILEKLVNISDTSISLSLQELQRIGLIEESDKGVYRLLNNLENYSINQFVEAVRWKLPNKQMIFKSEFSDKQLAKALLSILQKIEEQPTCSLKQSYRQV
ncbi:MAG: YihY family inner membrane protein [Gammaproteobacteria bacterium]|nr:YihY family inner membrane protein [Gammaproteobacteria bacterium]